MMDVDFCVPTKDEIHGFEMVMLSESNVELHWKSIEGMMRQVPHSLVDWTPSSILARALKGEVQIWGVGDDKQIVAVIFTQIAIFPAGRVLEVFWCAGQGIVEQAKELIDGTFELFAKKENCRRIDIRAGRFGWQRIMKERGFKQTAVTWSRPVTHEGMQ